MTARASAARRSFVVTSVAVLTVVGFVALWKLKVLVALLFLSFMLASAMRPGVERLSASASRVPAACLAHYAVFAGLIALFSLVRRPEHAPPGRARDRERPADEPAAGKAAKQTRPGSNTTSLSGSRRS